MPNEFIMVATAHFLALLSPGPDFILILRTSLLFRFSIASGVCVGISLANAFYITLCLVSLQFIAKIAGLYEVIKYLGAAYLLFLGYKLLFSKATNDIFQQEQSSLAVKSSFARALLNGFIVSLLNPKISIFYLSLFTVLIDESTAIITQTFYGVWMFLVVLCWDLLLVRLISSENVKLFFANFISKVEKVSGILLIGLGFKLALGS